MFCTRCGSDLGEEQICGHCGRSVNEKGMPVTAMTTAEKRFGWREPVAVLIAVILADITIYHGYGFAGLALLAVVLPILFYCGSAQPLLNCQTALFAGLTFLVSLKLFWCGNPAVVFIGLVIIFLFAALQARMPLRLGNLTAYLTNGMSAPPSNFVDYFRALRHWKDVGWIFGPTKLAAIFAPMALLFIFGTIFVFANPDLLERIHYSWNNFVEWLGRFSDWMLLPEQILIWIAVAWVMLGLLRPKNMLGFVQQSIQQFEQTMPVPPGYVVPKTPAETESPQKPEEQNEKTLFYYAYFNSLLSLILLFGVYLLFEFYRNWTRDFPPRFNYSQHMHMGAAYLTFALALSTLVLCSIFQGKTLVDPRIKTLKRLAFIWIGLNFLLAFAVYNRLYIYIDLNGLSWLRILGLLGTTAVALGLVMVVRMILRSEGIRWLVYRYTWSVLAVAFVGYILPFSWYISHHNVSRVMKGDLAPSIFLFPESLDMPEHYLASLPLLDSEDEIIREGTWTLFAIYYSSLEHESCPQGCYRWTSFQWSKHKLKTALEPRKEELRLYMNRPMPEREQTIKEFRKYTCRWI